MTDEGISAVSDLSHQALIHLVDRLDVGIAVINRDMEILFWNRFMASASRRPSEQVLGQSLPALFPEVPQAWFRKKLETVFVLGNPAFTGWQQRPYLLAFPNKRPITGGGRYMYQNATFIPMKKVTGEVESVCLMLEDVTDEAMARTELEKALERLEQSSRTDGLTQVHNRHWWEQCLVRECKRSDRYASNLSLILIDLDDFKKINDSLGHLAGDEVLRSVAAFLAGTIRDTDILGRYGGEEFGIIVSGCGQRCTVQLAERLREGVATLDTTFEGRSVPMTISLGIAEYTTTMSSSEELIARADQALYAAKEKGRNTWVAHDG